MGGAKEKPQMILFVHGVPDTPVLWQPVLEALDLAPGAFLAPALPGFGTPIPAGFDQSKDAYANWLVGEMERAGRPVHLVGHDWGALLVLRAASLRPDLVASWCVTNAVIDAHYRGHLTAWAWATPWLGELVMLAMRNRAGLERGLVGGGMPIDLVRQEVPRIDRRMRQSILGLYRSSNGLKFEGDWVDDLVKLPRRGQIYWGERDPYVRLETAERFARQLGFPVVVEQGAGHWACHERPREFAAVLKAHWHGEPGADSRAGD